MNKSITYLEHEEAKKVIMSAQSTRDRLVMTLLYAYGLRASELCNLKVKDIDIKNSTIYITPLKKKVSFRSPFIISSRVKLVLMKWLQSHNKKTDYLFYSKRYTSDGIEYSRISRIAVYKLVRKYCSLVGIDKERSHPHIFRHSLAVSLAQSGVDIYTAKEILRHSSVKNTEVYYTIANKTRNDRLSSFYRQVGM